MWAWYLEWSTIARTVIQNRRNLRRMGFLNNRSPVDELDEPDDAIEPAVNVDAPTEPQLSVSPPPRQIVVANQKVPLPAE
jgi:hypothetical protein